MFRPAISTRWWPAAPVSVAVGLPVAMAALGVKVCGTALEPFKFPKAVLISGGGAGHGEVSFRLDAAMPGYVRVNNLLPARSILTGDDLKGQATGRILDEMAARYRALPPRLQ